MSKRLSSLLVPFFKLVFAFALIGAVYVSFRDWSLPALFSVFVLFIVWYFRIRTWKKVYLKNGFLYISNYWRTVEAPISDITKIESSDFWGIQPQTITLKLKSRTAFGDEIVFIPNGGWMYAEAYANRLRKDLALI